MTVYSSLSLRTFIRTVSSALQGFRALSYEGYEPLYVVGMAPVVHFVRPERAFPFPCTAVVGRRIAHAGHQDYG